MSEVQQAVNDLAERIADRFLAIAYPPAPPRHEVIAIVQEELAKVTGDAETTEPTADGENG